VAAGGVAAGGTGGTGGCEPTNGGVERCDGVDNDCNDAVDDGVSCVPVCTPDATLRYVVCTDPRDWVSAEYLCETQGMRLIRIDDDAEQAYAQSIGGPLTSGDGCVWLGGSDLAVSGDWAWADGEVFFRGLGRRGGSVNGLYENFASGDPNHQYPEERCICFRDTGLWYDYRCYEGYPYLCEAH
jgi:hypothetical protein